MPDTEPAMYAFWIPAYARSALVAPALGLLGDATLAPRDPEAGREAGRRIVGSHCQDRLMGREAEVTGRRWADWTPLHYSDGPFPGKPLHEADEVAESLQVCIWNSVRVEVHHIVPNLADLVQLPDE